MALRDDAHASPFTRAVEEYIQLRPKKSKTPQFIRDLQHQLQNGESLDKQAVSQAMIQLEQRNSDSAATRNVRRIMKPVVTVLNDFSGVVDTFSQADPMPTALIWGCLKAVIQCSSRFLDLYEKIKDHLVDLRTHLEILTEYEELFGKSSTMQSLLQLSYIDVLRFWRRVEKECQRCIANRMSRAMASFSTTKIDIIMGDIEKRSKSMSLLVSVVKERIDKGERENAAEERRLAGLARNDQAALLRIQQEEMKIRNAERKAKRKKDLGDWLLGGAAQLNMSNHRHHEQNLRARSPRTCTWLSTNSTFRQWVDGDDSQPTIWVRAAPGVGKSVLCAYAITEAKKKDEQDYAICYQYYTFDEEFSELQVLRSLAEQLANALWNKLEDIPEEIHSLTLKSTTSSNTEDVKSILRMLIQHMSKTYIFLDGLDEECDNGGRWQSLAHVIEFFLSLAKNEGLSVKLWCSSQTRTCVASKLREFPSIEITSDSNQSDIKQYLSDHIPALDDLELDEGYKTVVLEELGREADGCFLWASLMLDSLSNAMSLQAIHEQMEKGLPRDYEKYYRRKLDSIDPANARFVSILLACIVYAKRPLRIEELCEGTAAIDTEDGEDFSRNRVLFKSQVISLCQPLVQVQETETPHGVISTCTLTHASVRKFLINNSEIPSTIKGSNAYPLTDQVMADICLKYLMQRRYRTLLKPSGDTFVDSDGTDVSEHHLLPYAAKYWDKHLDGVPYMRELCERVVNFVKSRQYFTLLQVQSMLVGGQFQVWWNSAAMWEGPQFKRVYPDWLDKHRDQDLRRSYNLFLSDWGYVLDQKTSFKGPFVGEIDRCLFQTLGLDNFLASGPSRYNSFYLGERCDMQNGCPARYFDAVSADGSTIVVLELKNFTNGSGPLEFTYKHWDITAPSPRLQSTGTLESCSRSNWSLYDYPSACKFVGRPSPVYFTGDLNFVRIATQIYAKGTTGTYHRLEELNFEDIYIDGLASKDRFVAITSRERQPDEAMDKQEMDVTNIQGYDYAESLAIEMAKVILVSATTTTLATTQATDETGETEQSNSRSSSVSDIAIEDDDKVAELLERRIDDSLAQQLKEDEAWFQSEDETTDNSAEESWSEGSSEMLSDEPDDEDQWNDWGNERLTFTELELEAQERASLGSGDDEIGSEAPDVDDDLDSLASFSGNTDPAKAWLPEEEGGDIEVSGYRLRAILSPTDDQLSEQLSSAVSLESGYSQSNYSDMDSEEESDYEDEDAGNLDRLIFGKKGSKENKKERTSIHLFDTSRPGRIPVFHFTHFTSGRIFDSPPVFHPLKSLLVWPMGESEILFADYKANTYFTRQLCRSTYHSCPVFIKAHFSPAADHLHFAVLEASQHEQGENDKGILHLSLQISTHRLSTRKTTKSPPRLIYRTTTPLGRSSSLNVSRLPYTLRWTADHVWVTTRGTTLDVMKIPLFRNPAGGENIICYVQNPIFLPRTVDSRTLHFIPSASQSKPGTRSRGKHDTRNFATVIVGSHSTLPSQRLLVPRDQIAPPMGVYLHEEDDLGGWVCKTMASQGVVERVNNSGGRLQSKFEAFDLKDDCDIIPFLY